MGWDQLTVAVKARKSNGKWTIGTGFPVARGLILTARHVVVPYEKATPICIRWWHCGDPGFGPADGPGGDGFLEAEIVWEDQGLDVALLTAPHPDGFGFVDLSDTTPARTAITCEGFPTGARLGNSTETIRIDGTVHSPHASHGFCQLDTTRDPEDSGDWGGLSGALVFPVDRGTGSAIAILTNARPAMGDNRTLHAVPTAAILQSPGYAEKIGAESDTHQPDPAQATGLCKALVGDGLRESEANPELEAGLTRQTAASMTDAPSIISSLATVLGNSGRPIGFGIVVQHNLVVTCAHVVAGAIAGDAMQATGPVEALGGATVRLEFTTETDLSEDVGTVETGGWRALVLPLPPTPRDRVSDLAVLRLSKPLPDGIVPYPWQGPSTPTSSLSRCSAGTMSMVRRSRTGPNARPATCCPVRLGSSSAFDTTPPT